MTNSKFKKYLRIKTAKATVAALLFLISINTAYGFSNFYYSQDGKVENRTLLNELPFSGNVYIFLEVNKPAKRVLFSIDGELFNGNYNSDEQNFLFPLSGKFSATDISPFVTAVLPNGEHTITASISYLDGTSELNSTNITIFNAMRENALENNIIEVNGWESVNVQNKLQTGNNAFIHVIRPPKWGTYQKESMVYTPTQETNNLDHITIAVMPSGGNLYFVTLYIKLNCDTCANTVIQLNWNPNPGSSNRYLIFHGRTPDSANKPISMVFNKSNIEINAQQKLQLYSGEQACFRLKAITTSGISDFSDAECVIL